MHGATKDALLQKTLLKLPEHQVRSKLNTIENYFQPLQVRFRERDKDRRNVGQVTKKYQHSTTPPKEDSNTDQEYEHRVKRRAHRENNRPISMQ